MANKVMLKVAKAGDPAKPTSAGIEVPSGKTPIDIDLDLRDRLAELAVKGNTLNPTDRAAVLSSLTTTLGRERAEKLMTHAFIFNSRPEVQRLSPEDKLKSFYTIGSSDPEIQGIIGRTKNLGYGVIPGFRGSVSDLNQAVQKGAAYGGTAVVDPEIQRKVMLRVGK